MRDNANPTGGQPEVFATSEGGEQNSPTITDAPTIEPDPTHITVNLDDQPMIEIVKGGEKTEFAADAFMIAVHDAGILKRELRDEWSKNLTITVEKVTGVKVGPLKAAEIYAGVLRLMKVYQKKAGGKLGSGTTSPDSERSKSEE